MYVLVFVLLTYVHGVWFGQRGVWTSLLAVVMGSEMVYTREMPPLWAVFFFKQKTAYGS